MIELLAGAAAAAAVIGVAARPPVRRLPGHADLLAPHGSAAMVATELVTAGVELLDRLRPARRMARRDAQLPDALDRLASALRGGQAVGTALAGVAAALPEPLGGELGEVTAAIAHGASVTTATTAWAQRPGASADVRLVAAAFTLGADAGGEVARAIDRVAATLRERRELEGEARSLATQARTSAGVLAIAPLAFTALVAAIQPEAVAFLFTTRMGLACLALGVGLEGLGATWMARIVRSAA